VVGGSSPSEGFEFFRSLSSVSVVFTDGGRGTWYPRSVHQRPPWTFPRAEFVEEADRMLASIAGEVAV
jgi:hypothetical protein